MSAPEPLAGIAGVTLDTPVDQPAPEMALCLSGGGYRAMLFHLGALWRLNECGYLPRLARISSVSGGSITAGVLGQAWPALAFDADGRARAFQEAVAAPILRLAGVRIDVGAVLLGLVGPGRASDWVIRAYRRHLFGNRTLQDLPGDDSPRFVFNASNLQSGVLWRFSRPYMRDYRVGEIRRPRLPLAVAVAASSAFPPFLSPVVLRCRPEDFTPHSGHDLQVPPYTTQVVLTDGGVYDNLGLETVWKRFRVVLVSDGGGRMSPERRPSDLWPFQAYRVLSLIDNQVRSLRERWLIDAFRLPVGDVNHRAGAYWGIRSSIAEYQLPDALPCPADQTSHLAETPTRLDALPPILQHRIVNWGYAVCDAAVRRYVDRNLPAPRGFPYPAAAIG